METEAIVEVAEYLAENKEVLVVAVTTVFAVAGAVITGGIGLYNAFKAATNGVALAKVKTDIRADDAVESFHKALGPVSSRILTWMAARANDKHFQRMEG